MDDTTASSMVGAKCFEDNTDKINNIVFSSDGTLMATSSKDDSIRIYKCAHGTKAGSVSSNKYGADLVHFDQSKENVLHASSKRDETVRYLSLNGNKYIRYFMGHTKKVVTLAMAPQDDIFLTGSMDKSVRLWDLRVNNCQGIMQVPSTRPIAAFDPQGLVFAAAVNTELVKLYDLRSYDKGPFATFKVDAERDGEWTGMRFSPNGKSILLMTDRDYMLVIDAFNGSVIHKLIGHQNEGKVPLNADFSPDAKYVFCGSSNGQVVCWSTDTGSVVTRLRSAHPFTPENVAFNPKFFMMASGCKQLRLWLPATSQE
ncbi:hypothetical protein AAVH_05988 [Aphelenchoides avenae]|nr:hypothetical protein AAVH_05988 [Aphelenchus avenae]